MDFSTALSGHRQGTSNPFLTCVTGWVNNNSQEERKFRAKACSHRKISANKTRSTTQCPWKRQSCPPAPLHLSLPCANINMCMATC